MKTCIKFILLRVSLVCILLFGAVFVWSLFTKASYDKIRADVNKRGFTVVQMGPKETMFLSEVLSNWVCRSTTSDGAYEGSIKEFGLSPSVANFIEVQSYHMPAYSWFSIKRNQESALKGVHKLMSSVDQLFHVAEDRKLAFVRHKPEVVYVFRDVGDASLGFAI